MGGRCRADNLAAEPVTGIPMGMSQTLFRIRLVNNGPACRLRGYPQHLTGLALTGETRLLRPRRASRDDVRSLTSRQPADLATGEVAEFVLHTALGCEGGRVVLPRSQTFTRLWFSLPQQQARITVVPGAPVDGGRRVIGLATCSTSMTKLYTAVPTDTASPG